MRILISYSSKWSVSLTDLVSHKNKVLSLKGLKDNPGKLEVILDEKDTYETVMEKVSKAYENFTYKTINKNTVLGIVSRLLGEIRYLDRIPKTENHPINKIRDKISFNLYDRNLYNEIVSLAKPLTKVPSNGGGLINNDKSEFLLLGNNNYSKIIFSLFNLKTLKDINDFLTFIEKTPSVEEVLNFIKERYEYKEKIELHKFVQGHNEHSDIFANIDKNYVKYKKYIFKVNKGEQIKDEDIVILDKETSEYINILNRIARFTGKNLDSNNQYNAYSELGKINEKNSVAVLNIIGLLYYVVTSWLIKINKENEILDKLINKNGNISGVASNSGKMTIKDFYGFISPRKLSWSMPYMFDSKYFKKKEAKQFNQSNTTLGVGKEDGTLEILIDVPNEEALLIIEQIEAAAVSTFHVGKKGLAYVIGIEKDE